MTTQYHKEQTRIQAQIQLNQEMLDVNHQLIEAQGINVNNSDYFNQVVAEAQNAVQTQPNPELQKPKRKRRSRRKYSIGKWNELEKAKYYLFLLDYKQQFRPKVFIQKEQLFKKMSEYIHSRSRVQCRSHHQKQQQKKRTYQQFFVDLYNQVKDHPLLANHQPYIQNKIQNLLKQQISVQQNNIIPDVPAPPVIIFEYKPNYDYHPISEIQFRKLFPSKHQ